MTDSILNGTKKILNIAANDDAFDHDIITHINAVFSTIQQLGIGPIEGFMISDDTAVWEDFIGSDLRLNQIRSYVYLRVRLLFDPPTTSYLIEALKEQAREMEWRLNINREGEQWTPPNEAQVI